MNFGLIGYGRFGKNHARTLEQSNECNLRVVIESNESLRQEAHKGHDCTAYCSFDQYLLSSNHPKIDAFIVATPAETHFDIVKKLLETKHHVLCEKPLVFTKKEAEKLHYLAIENNVILLTAYTFLSNCVYEKINKIFNSDDFGVPIGFASVRNNYGPIRSDIGVIYDLITHDISIVEDLIGYKIPNDVECSKISYEYADNKNEDIASVSLKYDGFFANCFATWLSPKKERNIKLFGSKMMLEWDDMSNTPIKLYKTPMEFNTYGEYSEFLANCSSTYKEMVCPTIITKEPLKTQLEKFTSLINKNNATFSTRNQDFVICEILERANSNG